jgi:putative transposase
LEVMALPQATHRCTRTSNCLERLNAEVKRSQKLIAIFPSEDLLIKLVGAYLIEENDRWTAKSKQYLPAGGRAAMRGGRRRSQR